MQLDIKRIVEMTAFTHIPCRQLRDMNAYLYSIRTSVGIV